MIERRYLRNCRGFSARVLKLLFNIGIETVEDLLFHLPMRYENRTQVTPIKDLQVNDQALVSGTLIEARILYGRRRRLECRLSDSSGRLLILQFFHFTRQQHKTFMEKDRSVTCFGTVRALNRHDIQMIHPEYRVRDGSEPLVLEDRLSAVYPTTTGLSQTHWRQCINSILSQPKEYECWFHELLPMDLTQSFQFPRLWEALNHIHRPMADRAVNLYKDRQHPAQQRLIFEELLAYVISRQQARQVIRHHKAPILVPQSIGNAPLVEAGLASQLKSGPLCQEAVVRTPLGARPGLVCDGAVNDSLSSLSSLQTQLVMSLPFSLTCAQKRVIQDIHADISTATPMLRLLQGDVGCGKTVVAAIAVIRAIENNYQVAVMAPTELLVEQHERSFQGWFVPLGIVVERLPTRVASRRALLQRLAAGETMVIIGTHALFQETVQFDRLGLIVIDEQHRFGVEQRLALKKKAVTSGYYPHQLMMSATPIPRTLAMTLHADLDISMIDERPSGRLEVDTVLVANGRREALRERVAAHCGMGHQAYWVCTAIEEGVSLPVRTVEATVEWLQGMGSLRVGSIHGQLPAAEKDKVIQQFQSGGLDILVATTIVEVGIDIPNASMMVIENAERLGLVQIHQLRGRVGRGSHKSYCVLLYQEPLSSVAQERLVTIKKTQDGFVVAEQDCVLRGPGDLLGKSQTGWQGFRIADLMRDRAWLSEILVAADKMRQGPKENLQGLLARWLKSQSFEYLEG